MRLTHRYAEVRRPAVQLWLRILVLCTLFAATQGVLGAWVVKRLAGDHPVVQVCTSQGVRWVVLDAQAPDGKSEGASVSSGPCVWAGAHVAMASALGVGFKHALPQRWVVGSPQIEEGRASGRVQRVLLMSSMRGPPAPSSHAI